MKTLIAIIAAVVVLGAFYFILKPDLKQEVSIPEQVSGDTAEIKVGETKVINGLSVTLLEVVNDYRCPVDAQCIEAGAIVAKVTFAEGPNTETINMPSDEVPKEFGTHKISIEKVSPDLHANESIKPVDYAVTFKVVQ